MGLHDTEFYLKINVGICNIISYPCDFVLYLPLFDAYVSYLQIKKSVTKTLTVLNYTVFLSQWQW